MFNNTELFKAQEIQINGKKAFKIEFPFDLKDQFRAAFKSAKWNREEKYWRVGSRSGKRLAQWIDAVAPGYEEFAKEKVEQEALEDEADLQEEHIKALQLRLEQLKRSIDKREYLEKRIEVNRAIIESLDEKIKEIDSAETTDVGVENARNENRLILSTAINLTEVERLTDSIINVLSTVRDGQLISKSNKARLNDLQSDLKKYIDELEEKGIEIEYLNECYNANGNRPDRDLRNILKMRENEAIYEVTKL